MSTTKSSGPLRAVRWTDQTGTALRRPDGTTLQVGPALSNRYAHIPHLGSALAA